MAFYSNISKVVLEPKYQIVAMYSTKEAERLISEYDVNLDRLPDYWVQRRFRANTEFNLRFYKRHGIIYTDILKQNSILLGYLQQKLKF
jgi:hypothetical protein